MTLTQVVASLMGIVGLIDPRKSFSEVATLGDSAVDTERTHTYSDDCGRKDHHLPLLHGLR